MTESPSGASGTGTEERWTRNAPPSVHSNVVRAASASSGGKGHAGTSIRHSPTRASRRSNRGSSGIGASSALREIVFGLLEVDRGVDVALLAAARSAQVGGGDQRAGEGRLAGAR